MLTIEYAKNPIYSNQSNDYIDLIVKFAEFANELTFTATHLDDTEHGRELYARAKNGEFGTIAEALPSAPEATQPQPVVHGSQTL